MPEPKQYARGGVIKGGGPIDDSIPFMLSRGCAVISPRMAAEHRYLLDKINGGNTDVVTADQVLEAHEED